MSWLAYLDESRLGRHLHRKNDDEDNNDEDDDVNPPKSSTMSLELLSKCGFLARLDAVALDMARLGLFVDFVGHC